MLIPAAIDPGAGRQRLFVIGIKRFAAVL